MKIKYSIASFLFVLILLSDCISFDEICAQDITVLRGVLLDDQTSLPIKDAHVYSSSNYATVTENNGQFSLLVKPNDTITVSCLGYGKVHIYVEKCPDFENYILSFRLKPTVYQLNAVEIPAINSVVLIPSTVKETVEVAGIEPIKDNFNIQVTPNVNMKLKRTDYKNEMPYFGIGFTINGLLGSLFANNNDEEKKLQERMNDDKQSKVFVNFMHSEKLKKLLMSEYNMTEIEYVKFINYFIDNAGRLKKSDNEYDILKAITDKLSSK